MSHEDPYSPPPAQNIHPDAIPGLLELDIIMDARTSDQAIILRRPYDAIPYSLNLQIRSEETGEVSNSLAAEVFEANLATSGLQPRQQEVVRCIANALTNASIGRLLEPPISEDTVKTHSRNIFWKLDLSNRTRTHIVARVMGLADRPPQLPSIEPSDASYNPEYELRKALHDADLPPITKGVINLAVRGATNKGIADALHITENDCRVSMRLALKYYNTVHRSGLLAHILGFSNTLPSKKKAFLNTKEAR